MVLAGVLTLASCTENEILIENNEASNNLYKIKFGEAFTDNATRASKQSSTNGTGFEVGDAMGIYGYQFNPSGDVDEVFTNTKVTKQSNGEWTYEGTKYWNPGSTYEFYGIYPQDESAYSFDTDTKFFTVNSFTVADAKDDQVDIMVAKKNETAPVNSVDMVFNHLLSNVNFYFKVQDKFNNSGIATYEVVNFDVTGLKSKGSYAQTGFDNNRSAVGTWTVDDASVYTYPAVTSGSIVKGEQLSLGDDLLLMPQAISDDATVSLTYRLVYKDGTTSTFGPRTLSLNKVRGLSRVQNDSIDVDGWQPNFRYNYFLAVNPSIRTNPTADYDGAVDGYTNPTGNVKTLDADDPANPYNDPSSPYYKENNTEVFWYVDVDNEDGDFNPNVDYAIFWVDLDGEVLTDNNGIRYTTLEAVVDKNRNGQLDADDKFDTDEMNYAGVADNATLNPYHLDVILQDLDNDGVAETPLQRDGDILGPEIPGNADVDGSIDGDGNPTGHVDKLDPDDPDNPTPGEDFYFVDIDNDGEYDPDVDYPIIWKDIDGDGKEEGVVDWNRDGEVGPEDNKDGDHTNYNGDPDDPDRNPDGVDVVLIEDPDNPGTLIELERDPKIPNNTGADWDGSNGGGDNVGGGTIIYTDVNDPDTYMIDVDGDGTGDYPIVWEDIDGDGKLEGGVDRDGDGHIDDVDQDGTNITTTPHDNDDDKLHKDPSDLTTTGDDAGKDVIMIYTDTNGDGVVDDNDEWKQLEWPSSGPDIVVWGNADTDGAENGYQKPYDYYVVVDGVAFIDVNRDGQYDPTVDYPIVWKDLDGTIYTDDDGSKYTTLEGIIDLNRNGKADAGDRVDNDGMDYLGRPDSETYNPDHLDVIMLDFDSDHVAETPLMKKNPLPIEQDTEIRFTADVDEWADDVQSEQIIRN